MKAESEAVTSLDGSTESILDAGPSIAGDHRAQDFNMCPRFFAYRWVMGLVPKQVERPLARGIVGHTAVGLWALRKMGVKDMDPYVAMQSFPSEIGYVYREMLSVVEDYFRHYRNEPFETVAVERQHVLKLKYEQDRPERFLHTQRVDRTILRQGKIWFMDLKCLGQPNHKDHEPRFWGMQSQFVGLTLMGIKHAKKLYGKPFGGTVVDIVSTTEPRIFKRLPVPVSREAVVEHVETLRHINRGMRYYKGRHPFDYPKASCRAACFNQKAYGRPCVFADLCWGRGRKGLRNFRIDPKMTVGSNIDIDDVEET